MLSSNVPLKKIEVMKNKLNNNELPAADDSKKSKKEKPAAKEKEQPQLIFRYKRRSDQPPLEEIFIEEGTVPKNKKVFTNSMRELKNQLESLSVNENTDKTKPISLLPSGTSGNDKDIYQIAINDTPKFVLKLADINKILGREPNLDTTTKVYRDNVLKDYQRDSRHHILNARREQAMQNKQDPYGKYHEDNDQPIADDTIVIVDIKSDDKEDIIYCNDKPLEIQRHIMANIPQNENPNYVEDYYYLENINSNDYKLEKVKGNLYLNPSVHDYLAPYFYPDDPYQVTYDRDVIHGQVDSEIEEKYNEDNYDSNAEYNSANDYPDEENSDDNSDDVEDDWHANDDQDDYGKKMTKKYFEDNFAVKIKKKMFNQSPRTDEINYHSNDTDEDDDDNSGVYQKV
jgi:hypothetical protein